MSLIAKARIAVGLVLLLAIVAGFYAFPKAWNATLGSVFNIETQEYRLGLDLQGGTHLVYQADVSEIAEIDRREALQGVRDVIERRVNLFGVSEPVVQVNRSGENYRLIVELAGIKDPAQAIEEIGKTPTLDFRILKEDANPSGIFQNPDDFERTELDGSLLTGAQVVFQSSHGGGVGLQVPQVSVNFNSEGSKLFAQMTEEHLGRPIGIFLDGNLRSAPVVQAVITNGQAVITGDYDIEEARSLARDLNAGALPVPIELLSQQTVGATLGLESLQASILAAIAGFILLALFMSGVYRFAGIIAVLSLIIYGLLILGAFKFVGVTISLAGIAGLILSLGMAVDANVLIFERIREELLDKETEYEDAVENGFRRAWSAIRDGNLTTILIAIILFWIGFGFVQGFALTLGIGVAVSLFTAVFFARRLLLLVPQLLINKPHILLPKYTQKHD